MQKFNQIFCDPKIVKVLHGADFDIQWLQRDFGVYVVNMFDTGQAARVLDYPKKSLAFLLEKFCDIKADKQYQLADWRIRPLPKEMEKYAIQDTHYLLYMYDRIRNELVSKSTEQNNYVLNVLNRSRQLCLQVYAKPGPVTEASYTALYNKLRAEPLTGVQLDCFAELFRWRDELARQEDESPAFVLPNRMMYTIAQQMPTTVEHLLSLCVPVPPLTRAYAHEITGIIHRARSGTLNTPGARGFYAITAVLRPEQNNNSQNVRPKGVLPAPQKTSMPFLIPSAPKASVDPANQGGVVSSPVSRNGMFSKSVEEDTKKHNAALASCLDDIGKSFDPLFASRVAEAAGVFDEEEEEERVEEEEAAKNNKKRGLEKEEQEEPIIPQSLAEIHRLTQRNKRQKKKKGAKGPSKPQSPLKFGSKSNPVDLESSPGTFMRKIGWEEEAKKIHQAPSGQNRLVTDHKADKKQSRRVEHPSQGFEITSKVKPLGKQGGKGTKGKSGFFVKERKPKQ
jgi:ribonuclease D